MNVSTLNDSFRFSFDMNLEGCVEAIAEAASSAAFNATKTVLDQAIAKTRSVIAAERNAKDAIWSIVSTTAEITEAVVHATDTRIDAVIDEKIIAPVTQAKVAIASPISKAWNATLDGITDYLESTPIKTVEMAESFPIQIAQVEDAIAKIEEVEAIVEEVNPIAEPALLEEKPQVIDDAIVSSAGVTNSIELTEAVEELQPKASSLSTLIREEVAKQTY